MAVKRSTTDLARVGAVLACLVNGKLKSRRVPEIVCLVPAHNEEEQIGATMVSLLAQTIPVTIVVSADNCTDRTVEIAKSYPGVIVRPTVGNTYKKAGALNQAWNEYGRDAKYVFTMDADTELAPDCLEKLRDGLKHQGAVCTFPGLKPPTSKRWRDRFMYRLIRLEFGRSRRTMVRRGHGTEVLAGMGAFFRNDVLRTIAAEYGGNPWRIDSIVEDYRISMDVRRVGYPIGVAPGAEAFTDAIVDLKALWHQRVRWQAGTFQELFRNGYKHYTRRVWALVTLSMANTLLRVVAMTFVVWSAIALHAHLHIQPIWLLPPLIAVVDGVDVVRKTPDTDWTDLLFAFLILPLEIFSILRESWTVWSFIRAMRRKSLSW
jgi:cellulose synthase/poly-beta-1,6-N-acetylglucosamine synthase-like glycosyltransferase